jgi:hypothetical protein
MSIVSSGQINSGIGIRTQLSISKKKTGRVSAIVLKLLTLFDASPGLWMREGMRVENEQYAGGSLYAQNTGMDLGKRRGAVKLIFRRLNL